MASSASTTYHLTKMSLLNRSFLVVCLIDLLSFIVFSEAEASYAVYNINVINEFPHDPEAYTQFKKFTHHMQDGWGLATDGKVLFGSDGTSTLYKIDLATMKVIR